MRREEGGGIWISCEGKIAARGRKDKKKKTRKKKTREKEKVGEGILYRCVSLCKLIQS